MGVENLTKDFYGRSLFRAFVRADDGTIYHDYAEAEVSGYEYRLYASRDVEFWQDVPGVERARVFARLYGKHTGRIYEVGKLFILVISDSEEPARYGVKFLVEEDGKVVAQLELFDNEYVLLLDGKELGREIVMLWDAGWQTEF
uniref:Uncharacterized protein n=1 Tax=Thermocrinis ruber TaxID=75906 RepID=A0A7C5SX58_9AQUI